MNFGDSMKKHMSVEELQVGMQIIDPKLDWKQHPYLFAKEIKVSTVEQIEAIKKEGYKEVYVDLFRSDDTVVTTPISPRSFTKAAATAPEPIASIDEELPKALTIHTESVQYARKFMSELRTGNLNIDTAQPFVENILESLERNADALISLSRLHRSDTYTYTHCVNVAILSTYFARCLGHSQEEVLNIGFAGMFHDVGKMLIPSQVLNAPRKLTNAEFNIMQSHPELGHQQLVQAQCVKQELLQGAIEHHEKYDGSGYPKGLRGEEISKTGRIIGVADVYDALTSKRVYKDAMYPHKALGIMYQMRDKHFESSFIEAFIRVIGIYPVGSVVALEDGHKGVIYTNNNQSPMQPVVILARQPDGQPMHTACNIAAGECAPIAHGIPSEGSGIDPLQVLGISA